MPADGTIVACLCAAWCDVCREYQTGFSALASDYPEVAFHWVDIEHDPAWQEDWDIEDFPTILVQRGETVVFLGPMLPQPLQLRRVLESLLTMDAAACAQHAESSAEHRAWQRMNEFGRKLQAR
ncbi:MAG TPA: thioredoxin family protein [Azoarcus sp.]|nr:thioredoxin family protein [Azoarcus sp.]